MTRSLDIEVVTTGRKLHYAFRLDYKTFCGKQIFDWELVNKTYSEAFNDPQLCQQCKIISFR